MKSFKKWLGIPTTTEKANKRAANLLQQYLAEINDDTQFVLFSPEQFNDVLKHFYVDITYL